MRLAVLADVHANLLALAAVAARRTELTGLMDVRDDHARTRSDLVTRVRSGVRAGYGPDSPQYEQAGGICRSERSERKRPARKPKA